MGAWRVGDWWRRALEWCRAMWKETLRGWPAAYSLLKRDLWKSALVIGLIFLLPGYLVRQAGNAGALVNLLRRAVCLPLMYAVLAHVQLSQLRGGSAAPLAVVRAKAGRWRELAPLAIASLILTEIGQFVIEIASGLLGMVFSLLAWIPLLGGALGVLLQCALLTIAVALQMATFSLWLVQERDGGSVMPTIVAAILFLRSNLHRLVGMSLMLAAARAIMIVLTPWQVWLIAEALCLLPGTAYVAALFEAAPGGGAYNPYAGPTDLDRMKRANIPED